MKKARIMLVAIGLFAIVGGVFAFKTRYFFPLKAVFTYAPSDSPCGGVCQLSDIRERYITTTLTISPAFYTTVALAGNACTTTCATYVIESAE